MLGLHNIRILKTEGFQKVRKVYFNLKIHAYKNILCNLSYMHGVCVANFVYPKAGIESELNFHWFSFVTIASVGVDSALFGINLFN